MGWQLELLWVGLARCHQGAGDPYGNASQSAEDALLPSKLHRMSLQVHTDSKYAGESGWHVSIYLQIATLVGNIKMSFSVPLAADMGCFRSLSS